MELDAETTTPDQLRLYDERPLETVWSAVVSHTGRQQIREENVQEDLGKFRQTEGVSNPPRHEPEIIRSSERNEVVETASAFGGIVGRGLAWRKIVCQIEIVTPTDAAVLVLGETGTGKELIARETHSHSLRKAKPLVKVNCACIPNQLYESEFFGRIRGAFTGAMKDRIGRFRKDLYYRLNVFPIKVAPLRHRKEDIPLLASHFIDIAVKELRCPRPRLTRAGIDKLLNYDWPGNIRELYNVIQRAAIIAQGGALEFDLSMGNAPVDPDSPSPVIGGDVNPGYLTEAEIRRRERENIFIVLQKTGWKIKGVAGAAELFGVKPTTLISRIEKLGLRQPA